MAVADDLGVPPMAGFERQPPQDIQAEQSVLGGMLLSKDAIADVVEVVRPVDFYRPAHQVIYETILDLYGRGEPADPVTVSAELTRSGQLMRVGGTPYLHTLISSVPTAANAGYYAEIVAERAVLRRLVEAGTRIVQLGYGAANGQGGEVDEVVDRAQAEIYDVTERRMSEDYVRLEQLLQGTMDEIDAIASRGGAGLGVPTGFAELDERTHGLHPGQMVVIAARPAVGKSTLALDVARSCSIRHGQTSVIFSLEMSKSEITMRLLSAEAKVPLHHMRSGRMSDDDWARLARRMGEVANAPLYVDDSPNLTMMEIRAKARRLKQRNDLRLVVVDYLQLMTSGKRVESRQQEVSEFSRSLKLLAKELEVPVIAISQLNRSPEQRQDKKPMLADLRECLAGDTLVVRADTGERVPISDLAGQRDVPVWTLDERLRLRRGVMAEAWCTGVRSAYRITLASGRQLTATANHPLLTIHGWTPVEALRVGGGVATARAVPRPGSPAEWSDDHLLRLGIGARLRPQTARAGARQRWTVDVCSQDDMVAFLTAVGVHGERGDRARDALTTLDRKGNPDVDVVPPDVWDYVRKAMRAAGITTRALAKRIGMSHCGSALYRAGLSRERMARVASAVPDPYLASLATSDVRWDRIVSIEPAGAVEVFDARVPGSHCFLANDVISHNSGAIEQDSDLVILLHREDIYERESPRAGEADLILAKHRNGPTGTVTVAFQGHYSRFVDMAT
jgi:replicative DNA helicase